MSQASGQPSETDATLISGDSVIGEVAGMGRLAPGKTFADRYRLLARLGVGGAGILYLAYDTKLDRKVALELLRPRISERVMKAAERVAAISHPNLLAIYEVGTLHDVVFVVTDHVDGGSLREWIDAAPHPWPLALELFRKLAAGLAAAHRAELIHGDLEPEHVLLTGDLEPRIAAFGLAEPPEDPRSTRIRAPRRLDDSTSADPLSSPLTPVDQRCGPWAYRAPECYAGAPADAGSDQFAFCVSFYEALYGERPFEGRSIQAVLLAITEGRIRQPRTKVPAWLRRVLIRGLARDPARRWPSMDALLDALEQAQSARRRRVAVGVLALIVTLAAVATIAGSIAP